MAYVNPVNPVGVNPVLDQGRIPVIKVFNGDSWVVDANLYNPADFTPATVENTVVEFILTENRFTKYVFWTGKWMEGVVPDENIPGLVHVKVPKEVSASLRRGIYAFSLRVTDHLDGETRTEFTGYFQVEYEPTSDTHDIPYRPNSDGEDPITPIPGGKGGKGEKGPTGERGEQGDPGVDGPTGDRGITGPTGGKGEQGERGEPGEPGKPGDPGDPGEPGAPGLPGATGAEGATGMPGPDGKPGEKGPTGVRGGPGETGSKGPTGGKGVDGPTGEPGKKGVDGPTGEPGKKGVDGPTGAVGAKGEQGPTGGIGDKGANGPTGEPGPVGAEGPTGISGPEGATGKIGCYSNVDMGGIELVEEGYPCSTWKYEIHTRQCCPSGTDPETGEIYYECGEGYYVASGTFQACAGPYGPTGVSGATGFDGPTGFCGSTGFDGPTGFYGPTGHSGPTGVEGAPGQEGPTGLEGPPGREGATGLGGLPGLEGPTGREGPTGLMGDPGSVSCESIGPCVEYHLDELLPGKVYNKLDSVAAAPDFSSSSTYFVGDYVTYHSRLYKCTTAVTTAGDWTGSTNWEEVDMTSPDATLDITNAGFLRVVSADGEILWAEGYNLSEDSSDSMANWSVRGYAFAANATSGVSLSLPTAMAGKVGDFILDVTNPALDTTSLPTAFSDSATYAAGDIVSYDSKIWRCVVAVDPSGAWTGTTNWEEAWPYFTLAQVTAMTASVVVPEGEDINEMLKFAPGTMCELYFTQTAFNLDSKPTWKVVRQDVEDGGAS